MGGEESAVEFNPIQVVDELLSDFEKRNRVRFSDDARQKFRTPALEQPDDIRKKIHGGESSLGEMKEQLELILWDAVKAGNAEKGLTEPPGTVELSAMAMAMLTCRWWPWC
jgi:hypothetical protein